MTASYGASPIFMLDSKADLIRGILEYIQINLINKKKLEEIQELRNAEKSFIKKIMKKKIKSLNLLLPKASEKSDINFLYYGMHQYITERSFYLSHII